MAEPALTLRQQSADPASDMSETSEKKPWERMDGEPVFWYNRFKRFRGLGPKRTVLAALEQEQGSIKALKSTDEGAKRTRRPVSAQHKHLTEVQKLKPLQVPGSWKAASIKWRWIERAQAYDEYKVDQIVEEMMNDLYEGPALALNRVLVLRNLFKAMAEDFNKNNARMTADQRIAFYARITATLRDIRDEMKNFDESAQRVMARQYASKIYRDHKSLELEEKTEVDFERLMEKLGGPEATLKAMEAEEARRAQAVL